MVKAIETCDLAGLPSPVMNERNGGFMVTLFYSSHKKVTEKEKLPEKLPERLGERLGENLQKLSQS
jgi:hypothetical protein